MISLCFGRDVRTRLGVAISGSPVFHIKVGRPVKCLAHAGLFSTTYHKCPAPSREAMDTIFKKVFWYDSTRGMSPMSTDCEADALTTTPTCRLRYLPCCASRKIPFNNLSWFVAVFVEESSAFAVVAVRKQV